MLKELNRSELLEIANTTQTKANCPKCESLACVGWETVPGSFDIKVLKPIGTLRIEGAPEFWEEDHPNGTNL